MTVINLPRGPDTAAQRRLVLDRQAPTPVFRSRPAPAQQPDLTPEQAAILSLLGRVQALERRLAEVEGRHDAG